MATVVTILNGEYRRPQRFARLARDAGPEPTLCPECFGCGRVVDESKGEWSLAFEAVVEIDCPECGGTGEL